MDLSGTAVSDIGVAHLRGLTNLKTLWLEGTQVSDKGVNDLKHALPTTEIIMAQPDQK